MNELELAYLAADHFCVFPKLGSGYKIPKHSKYLADRIQEALIWQNNPDNRHERYKIFIVSGPPRHGKSELVCRHGPPWILGNYPTKKIIIASYQASLSEKHSRKARALFEKWGPILWESYPSKTTFAGNDWETDQGGGTKAVGIQSGASGYGADVLLIDDYHADSLSAESKLQRDNVWDWWQSAAIERLHPAGIVVIYATRWHEDDLVGRLLDQEKELKEECPFEIEHIKFPALAEENDVLGRKPGEALWPWWKDENILNKIKIGIGSYVFAALFQGHPRARGGTLFKSEFFRYYTRDAKTGNYLCWKEGHKDPVSINKHELVIHVYVDPAIETKSINDPTGMLAWGYSRKNKIWLLLDRLNDRIEHTKVLEKIKTFALKNNASSIGIENEKLGKVLVKQSAGNDDIGGRKIAFKEVPTGGVDKYARATTMANYFECERVFLPQGAIWLSDYENSLVGFPRAAHDEDVDCTSMAENMESKSALEDLLRKRR
jgi:predicted phage terminase large subunit-like protein